MYACYDRWWFHGKRGRKHNKETLMIQLSQQKRKHPKLPFTYDSLHVAGAVCYKWNKKDAALPPQELTHIFQFQNWI